jgi:hypothetical protein
MTPLAAFQLVVGFRTNKKTLATLTASEDVDSPLGAPKTIEGSLSIKFSTGYQAVVPVKVIVSSPVITLSAAVVDFGVCRVHEQCEGFVMLSNPTLVRATWGLVHIPEVIILKQFSTIKPPVTTDDPAVFDLLPREGEISGPTVAVATAIHAPPKDFNRCDEPIVAERLSKLTWKEDSSGTIAASSTTFKVEPSLALTDTLRSKDNTLDHSKFGSRFPQPITIVFRPKKDVVYKSRFRFQCENGNQVDLLLEGTGTYEEIPHNDVLTTRINS